LNTLRAFAVLGQREYTCATGGSINMNTTLSITGVLAASIVGAAVIFGSGMGQTKHVPDQSRLTASTGLQADGPEKQPQSKKTMTTTADGRHISKAGYDVTPLPPERVAQLASKLDEETFRITQKAGTEPAFCGNLLDNKKQGVYTCVVCGLPLFASENKFISGTGWPSFDREVDPDHVARITDDSLGMVRTEINCARCGSHLGHVFDDGPKTTGERHCLNSASLVFYEKGKELPPQSQPIKTETAYFAGGCFWGIEHYFQMGPGVINAESGYMQGRTENPTYEEICAKGSGHAETVKVIYDPSQITYKRLLQAFFDMHDPTQLNRQGPDYGDQYRSGIWVATEDQKREAQQFVEELKKSGRFKREIVTEIEKAKTFYPAEAYHQDYIATTGRACHVTNPW
jgi:peptide methionine sulfoxide reductase msrA/msrB